MHIATLSVPASDERENEDAAVVLESRIGVVVDGAGLPKTLRAGCEHSVAWYSHLLADRFATALLDDEQTMQASLARALGEVAASHGDRCDLSLGSPSGTTAAFRMHEDRVEWLVLSDASVVIVTRHGTVEHCDDRLQGAMLAATTTVLNENGLARHTALPAQLLEARVVATQRTRNVDGGWWCCQDDPAAADHASTGSVAADDIIRLALCSDGATRGHQLLDLWSVDEFGTRLDDPAAIAEGIRAGEDQQRQRLETSLQKVHDDLTIVLLSDGPCPAPRG